jgi:hypothetical protein
VGFALTLVGVRAKFTPLEGSMFEGLEAEEREKQASRKKRIWISVYIIAAVVVVVALVYVMSRARAKTPVRVQAPAPAAKAAPPNALRDLKVVHATMGKDVSGVRVMWSVQLRNKSTVYTYTDIEYEASLIGLDGKILGVNRDTIKDSIGPGEEKRLREFIDGFYDARASTYLFVLTGAKATTQ